MTTYTVIGVWEDDGDPVPVGVIAGQHDVVGGDEQHWEGGLWATSVEAATVDAAEVAAVAEMEATRAVYCTLCDLQLEKDGNGEWWAPGEERPSSCPKNDGGAHDPDNEEGER